MDMLFDHAALPEVDRTSGLLKYVRTCFQFMGIDRAGAARAPLLCFREQTFANGNFATLEDHLQRADHEFQIELFYEQSNLVDAFYARSHQHLSRLNFHPLANTMFHNCLRSMMADGRLARFF